MCTAIAVVFPAERGLNASHRYGRHWQVPCSQDTRHKALCHRPVPMALPPRTRMPLVGCLVSFPLECCTHSCQTGHLPKKISYLHHSTVAHSLIDSILLASNPTILACGLGVRTIEELDGERSSSETIVNVHHRNSRSARVEHRQEWSKPMHGSAVANACGHGNNWTPHESRDHPRHSPVHTRHANRHVRFLQRRDGAKKTVDAGHPNIMEARHLAQRQSIQVVLSNGLDLTYKVE